MGELAEKNRAVTPARRSLRRLDQRKVDRLKLPGRYADGAGLYLQISEQGVASWVFRYERNGRKERTMGLGPRYDVSLEAAREEARLQRELLRKGIDPIDARAAQRAETKAAAASEVTFADACAGRIAAMESKWKNAKHRQQWENTLATYAEPLLGRMVVRSIDTPHVLAVLKPIWHEKTETASRVRARIEAVLDWATISGYRSGPNPARWKGHLDQLLPEPKSIAKVVHHPALDYRQISAFVAACRAQEGLAARALELTILTASRTSEVLAARWSEVDLKAKVWTVPAERMKMKREHRIPLSSRAIAILKALPRIEGEDFLFPGAKRGQSLSNMAMLALLKRMGREDLTVHGFRSTFRDWAGETTAFPREVIEMALAHKVGNSVESAYARGDLLEKRRPLMDEWAAACAKRR